MHQKDALIFEEAIAGNKEAFNRFFTESWKQLNVSLQKLTHSEQEARRIFICGMTILWESFILKQQNPPENVQAYLYVICKNEWLAEKKRKQAEGSLIDLQTTKAIATEEPQSPDEVSRKEDDDLLIKKLMVEALEKASERCKKIMELHIEGGKRLKELWPKLGFNSYQAIVQAKYNCKKRLGNYVFRQLQKNKVRNS